MKNFSEVNIERMTDSTYKSHFRLTRNSFRVLHETIHNHPGRVELFPWEGPFGTYIEPTKTAEKEPITLKKSLQITIWYFGNQVSMRDVADRFGIGKGI